MCERLIYPPAGQLVRLVVSEEDNCNNDIPINRVRIMKYKSMKERINEERAGGVNTRVKILVLDNDNDGSYFYHSDNSSITILEICLPKGVEIKNLDFTTNEFLRLHPRVDYLTSLKALASKERLRLEMHSHSNSELEMAIKKMTSLNGKFDYVFIGNNYGVEINKARTGINRARAVDESLRAEKACIVWDKYYPGDETEYQKLGYTKFLTRDDLPEYLTQLFCF